MTKLNLIRQHIAALIHLLLFLRGSKLMNVGNLPPPTPRQVKILLIWRRWKRERHGAESINCPGAKVKFCMQLNVKVKPGTGGCAGYSQIQQMGIRLHLPGWYFIFFCLLLYKKKKRKGMPESTVFYIRLRSFFISSTFLLLSGTCLAFFPLAAPPGLTYRLLASLLPHRPACLLPAFNTLPPGLL